MGNKTTNELYPDDKEIGDLVENIAYKQYSEEQSDDFVEKVWIIKNKLNEWFGNKKTSNDSI